MGYLPPTTIAETLRRIQRNDLVLPAIQREFVWKPSQIVGLFDSIMRGYPIGGFLSWKVDPETVRAFRFYGFVREYSQLDGRHNPTLDVEPGRPVTAMLDGQQRLTSLNVGFRGSYAWKKPRAWSALRENYPVRRLYLNIRGEAEQNEAGLRYDFRFLSENQLASLEPDDRQSWFPVSTVYESERMAQLWSAAARAGLANDEQATELLSTLWEAVHASANLHFYEEVEQDVERVLDIFIRVNSAGTVLSYSDLLLSIATAQWKGRDARTAIHGLVDRLNATGQGFGFNQDVVLKSGLVLAGIPDIAFKVANFTSATMARLDEQWDAISRSLEVAAGLLADFGLSRATLSANSVLIPVAHYVHRRGLSQHYREAVADSQDRAALRSWTLRSLIVPGVWGAGLDTLLRDLRQSIDEHGTGGFPVNDIERRMAARGKSLTIGREQIDDLLTLQYGSPRTFAVLATVFDHVNTRNVHHVDHVFPASHLTPQRLRRAGVDRDVIEVLVDLRDRLPNLQLLEGLENISKSDTLPAVWAQSTFTSDETLRAYQDRNAIPRLAGSVDEFEATFAERREALAARIAGRLGGPTIGADDATTTVEPSPSAPIADAIAQPDPESD